MSNEVKKTKITIQSDRAVGNSSIENGSNLEGVAFNIQYVANKDVHLANEIVRLFREARELENR